MCCHKYNQEILWKLKISGQLGNQTALKIYSVSQIQVVSNIIIPYCIHTMWQTLCYVGTPDSKVNKTCTVLTEIAIKKGRQNFKIETCQDKENI